MKLYKVSGKEGSKTYEADHAMVDTRGYLMIYDSNDVLISVWNCKSWIDFEIRSDDAKIEDKVKP